MVIASFFTGPFAVRHANENLADIALELFRDRIIFKPLISTRAIRAEMFSGMLVLDNKMPNFPGKPRFGHTIVNGIVDYCSRRWWVPARDSNGNDCLARTNEWGPRSSS